MKTTRNILIALIIVALFALYGVYKERDVPQAGQTLQIEADIAINPAQATFEDLLDAIEQVESGGDSNAVGDGGAAIGAYQIHKIYVDDVNRLFGETFTYEDRWNRLKSRWMTRWYIQYYASVTQPQSEIQYFEYAARIHNGGPNGWKKESTKPYWEKVKRFLAGVN